MTDLDFDNITDEQLETLEPVQLQELVAYWRRKCLSGTVDMQTTKRIVKFLRAGRLAAVTNAAKKASKPRGVKAQAAQVNSDALLNELDNL